jgi:hypothetical protein
MTGPTAPFDAEPIPADLAPAWLRVAEEVDLPATRIEPVALTVVLDAPPDHPDLPLLALLGVTGSTKTPPSAPGG